MSINENEMVYVPVTVKDGLGKEAAEELIRCKFTIFNGGFVNAFTALFEEMTSEFDVK